MKHPQLVYGFIAVLGISFLGIGLAVSIFFEFTQWVGPAVLFGFLPGGTCLLAGGVCGIERQHACRSGIFYRLLVILGVVCLTLFLAVFYLDSVDAISFLEPLYPSRFGWFLPIQLGWFILCVIPISGIVFLVVGMVGIGRQHFTNHGNLLTVLLVLFIPLLILATVIGATSWMIDNSLFTFPVRDEITRVDLISNNPLVVYLGVKAITCEDSRIDSAIILDSHNTLVAEYRMEEIVTVDEHGDQMTRSMPIYTLSGGSSMTLTLRFNCTLPPGDYTVRLTSWEENHGSASFTIP